VRSPRKGKEKKFLPAVTDNTLRARKEPGEIASSGFIVLDADVPYWPF
jgi:hypothetical protein